MSIIKSELSWIVVKDLKKAIEFYTKVLGLTLHEHQPQFNWAELGGSEEGGARLGIAQECEYDPDSKPGQNAVMTFTVENFEASKKEFERKGAKFVGTMMEVPGQVKMQTFVDLDKNHFQIVERLA